MWIYVKVIHSRENYEILGLCHFREGLLIATLGRQEQNEGKPQTSCAQLELGPIHDCLF